MTSEHTSTVLSVDDLHTHFFLHRGVLKAVNGVSFALRQGEVLGLVGETGCGKSVLAKSIMNRVPAPGRIVGGEVVFRGESLLEKTEDELRAIRGRDISMVVQNPHAALNPFLRVRDQIANVYRAHQGDSKQEAHERALDMTTRVGIPDPRRRALAYPHELSGGMAQRIVIAMALACSPTLLIADEPTTGLDVIVQSQVLDLIAGLVREDGISMILITHDLGVVAQYCDTVGVMVAGHIVEYGKVADLFRQPLHPYTAGLLGATPDSPPVPFLVDLSGPPIDPVQLPTGCHFQPRCPFAQEICKQPTSLEEILPGHSVRCWRVGKDGDVSAFKGHQSS